MTNFNKPLLGVDMKPVEADGKELQISKTLAPHLAGHNKGDALKFFTWAVKLHAGEELSLDESDKATLTEFVKNSEAMTNLFKAQVLQILKD